MNNFSKYLLLFSTIAFSSPSFAGTEKPKQVVYSAEKVQQYDSLLSVWYENSTTLSYDNFFDKFIDIDTVTVHTPILPDSIYKARLDMLATEVNLPYNSVVKRYIESYLRSDAAMGRLMGLARYYMPIFERELDLQGMPEELKIVPIIESALNPTAKSWVGAGGLWQFMVTTGKIYGLKVDSFIDERYDPIKSTKVACQYMKELYRIYGDWTLVIAAYNCGPGNVNKAILRAGNASNYWGIYDYLPRETRNHIPAFIAATYAYTYHKAHGIKIGETPIPLATDTIMVNQMVHFDQIATTIPVSKDVLRRLNPQYKIDIIPAIEDRYPLVLPLVDVATFIDNEENIYAKDSIYLAKYKNATAQSAKAIAEIENSTTHKVKSGETLGGIALKYRTSSSTLMRLNGIRDARRLRVGQVIRVR